MTIRIIERTNDHNSLISQTSAESSTNTAISYTYEFHIHFEKDSDPKIFNDIMKNIILTLKEHERENITISNRFGR